MPSIARLLLEESQPFGASSGFSYRCARCFSCCRMNRIPINPHEVLLLSRFLKLKTSALLQRYAAEDGSELQRAESGCVFLGADGCTVYPARPLVCRLYPLRRHRERGAAKSETFSLLPLAPESGGDYGTAGSVANYLKEHDCSEHLRWLDRYIDAAPQRSSIAGAPLRLNISRSWMDVDAIVEAHCRETGRRLPEQDEEKLALHLELLTASLE